MSPAEAAARPPAVADAAATADTERRNFRRGIWNGAVFQAGDAFIDSGTVVPLFLARLTASNALIGLGSSLVEMGFLLPQFAVAPSIARHPRQLWLYRNAAIVRAIALGLLAVLTTLLAGSHPEALLALFFVGYGIYCFGGGVAALPFMEVVTKVVPAERLGVFWARRLFWGGLLAAAAGLLVRRILEIEDFGLRYGLLFAIATVLVSSGYALFLGIEEPAGTPGLAAATPMGQLREGVRLLRGDATFRRLLLARATLSLWYTTSPFLVLFAVRDLGGGPQAAGTFLFARVTGYVLSNLLWSRMSRRWGHRAVLQASVAGIAALALMAALVAWMSPFALGWISNRVAILLLEGLAGLGGAVLAGMLVGYASIALVIAPPERRQTFLSLMHSFLGPTLLLPMLGGAIVDATNAPLLFALCGAGAMFGWRAASRLPAAAGAPSAPAPPGGETAPGGGP